MSSKVWRENNPEKIKAWKNNNPEKISKHNKQYRKKYPEKVKKNNNLFYAIYRTAWRSWFIRNGFVPPSCQFNYHHIDPETKLFKIGSFIGYRSCSIKWREMVRRELEKCVLLSSKEHKKIHKVLKNR